MDLSITLLYIVFVLSAIVLVTVILLQEGQGGGFSAALGTAGQQAFGVKAKGIQSFTGIVAAIWIASGLGIHVMNGIVSGTSVVNDGPNVTEAPIGGGGASAPAPGPGTGE